MLDKIFNVKNPFWRSMGTIYDLFIVNCLWLLCCIPVFTILPSTTAAFYCLIERLRGDRGYISQNFFYSFKKNFKQGVLMGIPLTLLGAFLAADIYMCKHAEGRIFVFFMFFFIVIFAFWCFTMLYTFAILAKFERSSKDTLIWSFTLAIKNLPLTMAMMFVIIAGIWLCHIVPGLVFIMFGLCAQFCATVIVSILKPYLPDCEFDYSDDNEIYDFNPHGPYPDSGSSLDDEAKLYGYDPAEAEALAASLSDDSESEGN